MHGGKNGIRSQDCALGFAALDAAPDQARPLHRLPQRQVKDLLDAPSRHRAHLRVLGAYPLGDCSAFLGRDRMPPLRLEERDGGRIGAQVRLGRDEDNWDVLAKVRDFGVPLRARMDC